MVHAGPGHPPSPGAAQRPRCTRRDRTAVIRGEGLTAWAVACLQAPSGRPGPFGAILQDDMRVKTHACTHTYKASGGFTPLPGRPVHGQRPEQSPQGAGLCLVGDRRGLVTDLEAAPLPINRSCEHLKEASVSLERSPAPPPPPRSRLAGREGCSVSRGWWGIRQRSRPRERYGEAGGRAVGLLLRLSWEACTTP